MEREKGREGRGGRKRRSPVLISDYAGGRSSHIALPGEQKVALFSIASI